MAHLEIKSDVVQHPFLLKMIIVIFDLMRLDFLSILKLNEIDLPVRQSDAPELNPFFFRILLKSQETELHD